MAKKILSSIVGFAFLFSANQAFGQEIYDFYSGVRQLGMGGVYTAVVNDETALLTNPAGLGKIRDIIVTVADAEVHLGSETTRVAKLDNMTKVLNVQGLLDALNETKGTHWHAKAQVFPSLVGPNFGFGLHAKYAYDAEVSPDGAVYRLDYRNDYAFALGYNFRFFNGILKVGFAARLVDRIEVAEDLDATATGLELSSLASEGMGVGADLGVILSAPVALLPALSVVVRDVGNTSYSLSDGLFMSTQSRPRHTEQRVDAGIALFPILSNRVRATFAADYHGVMTASEEKDPMRRVHVGCELNVADFLFLRAGMNQRYWTAGLEFASERFQLQMASYGEEIGAISVSDATTTVKTREDRRYVGKIAIRF